MVFLYLRLVFSRRTFNHPTLLCKYDQEANTEFVPPEMRS
ncbi:unnamed protein product, partial [Rotaria sordida]